MGKRLAIALAGLIAALLFVESLVRLFALDWRAIEPLLSYAEGLLEVHEPAYGSRLMYRLRPNSRTQGRIHINSLGFRGPERSPEKRPGVFRIICLGGSNVFGAGVGDYQTWPAYLGRELGQGFEVWNLGVSGYNPEQSALWGREAVGRFSPDLVIYGLSNEGARFFLTGSSVKQYFAGDPNLWCELFAVDGPQLLCIRHIRLIRLMATAALQKRGKNWHGSPQHGERNLRAAREFIQWAMERTKVVVFIYPGADGKLYRPYHNGLEVPVIRLSADGMPTSFADIHPPAAGYAWYGRELAAWLRDVQSIIRKPTIPARHHGLFSRAR